MQRRSSFCTQAQFGFGDRDLSTYDKDIRNQNGQLSEMPKLSLCAVRSSFITAKLLKNRPLNVKTAHNANNVLPLVCKMNKNRIN